MSAPQAIVELVESFERNLDAYSSPAYKEAEVRREFIDPFFDALGWDVQNRRKYGSFTPKGGEGVSHPRQALRARS